MTPLPETVRTVVVQGGAGCGSGCDGGLARLGRRKRSGATDGYPIVMQVGASPPMRTDSTDLGREPPILFRSALIMRTPVGRRHTREA